jgi:hypothetical protein
LKTAIKKVSNATVKVDAVKPQAKASSTVIPEESEDQPPNAASNVGTNAEIREHMKLNT